MERLDYAFAALLAQVVKAPPVGRLEDLDRVAQCQQFTGNAPQSMGAGMIPVGQQGMVEQDETHGAFSSAEQAMVAWLHTTEESFCAQKTVYASNTGPSTHTRF